MSASPESRFPRLSRSVVVVGVIAMVVIVTAGILLLGGRDGEPGSAIAGVRIYQCPQGANLLGEIAAGTQVGIIARSEDGDWLQFYHQAGDYDRVWAERAALAPAMDTSPLPVADCGVAGASASPVATFLTVAAWRPKTPRTRSRPDRRRLPPPPS